MLPIVIEFPHWMQRFLKPALIIKIATVQKDLNTLKIVKTNRMKNLLTRLFRPQGDSKWGLLI